MRMHEFVSRSLKRRMTGKQRSSYYAGRDLLREHGGPTLRRKDRGHTEAILAHHGISSIPKEDREIGFRGKASVTQTKKHEPVGRGGGHTYSQQTGFGVGRSFKPTVEDDWAWLDDPEQRGNIKPAVKKPTKETVLNPKRRRAHQIRGGPTPHYSAVKHHMPPHGKGAEPGGESSPLSGSKKLNQGLGPAAHPTPPGRESYVHPESVTRHRDSANMPRTGGEQHVHYTGSGNIQPLSKRDGGISRRGGTVPKERVVGIGHIAAESLRKERSKHGEGEHDMAMDSYKRDLARYEGDKKAQSGKRGGGRQRGPRTGEASSSARRIYDPKVGGWVDAKESEKRPIQHGGFSFNPYKNQWEGGPHRGTTAGYAGGGGFQSAPKKPEKPEPLSNDKIGTKKGLRNKYKEWKKTGETAFHHPDGTPKSSFQPSDELIRYHTARERNPWIRTIHDYHVLKSRGKAPRLPHEGGKHPADFHEFGRLTYGRGPDKTDHPDYGRPRRKGKLASMPHRDVRSIIHYEQGPDKLLQKQEARRPSWDRSRWRRDAGPIAQKKAEIARSKEQRRDRSSKWEHGWFGRPSPDSYRSSSFPYRRRLQEQDYEGRTRRQGGTIDMEYNIPHTDHTPDYSKGPEYPTAHGPAHRDPRMPYWDKSRRHYPAGTHYEDTKPYGGRKRPMSREDAHWKSLPFGHGLKEFSDTPAQEHHRKNSSVHNELVKKHRLKSGQSYNVAEHGEPPRGVFHSWAGGGGGMTWRVLSPDEHWSRNRPSHNQHEFANASKNLRTNLEIAQLIQGGLHEDPRKATALRKEAANRNIGEGKFTGPLDHPEESRFRSAKKAYRAMNQKGRMQRIRDTHIDRHYLRPRGQRPPLNPRFTKGEWDSSYEVQDEEREHMHEFYGPSINLRSFRPGHLEFRGRKTGGRGKKMMMPGHYKFAFTPDYYSGRSKPWNTGPNVGDIPEMTRTRKAAELRNSRERRQTEARMKSSLGRHRRDRPHLRGRLSQAGEEAVHREFQPAQRINLRHPEFEHPSDQGGPMSPRRGLGDSERHRAVMKEGRRILSHPAQRVRTSRVVQPRVRQMGIVPEGFVPKVARALYSEFASQRGGPQSLKED